MARDRFQDSNPSHPDFGDLADDLGDATRNTSVQSEPTIEGATGARARLQEAAKPVVRRAGRAVGTGADYIRSHDFEEIRGDLEREIRAHPIKSIALALGAGYLLGKIFR